MVEKAVYDRRRVKNACIECGRDIEEGIETVRCKRCATKSNKGTIKRREIRRRREQCADCGKPSLTYRCLICGEIHNVAVREARRLGKQHG